MARKVLEVDLTTGQIQRTPDLVLESSDAVEAAVAQGIPRAGDDGRLAIEWLPDIPIGIDVTTASGSPSLLGISSLIIGDNLTLINAGGGAARIDGEAGGGGGGGSLTVQEADGIPSVALVDTIIVGSGDLIDNGNGAVRLKTASDAVGSGGTGDDGTGGSLYLFHVCI